MAEFAGRYLAELDGPERQAVLKRLRAMAKDGPVTLVTSAKDIEGSHVPVLAPQVPLPLRNFCDTPSACRDLCDAGGVENLAFPHVIDGALEES